MLHLRNKLQEQKSGEMWTKRKSWSISLTLLEEGNKKSWSFSLTLLEEGNKKLGCGFAGRFLDPTAKSTMGLRINEDIPCFTRFEMFSTRHHTHATPYKGPRLFSLRSEQKRRRPGCWVSLKNSTFYW